MYTDSSQSRPSQTQSHVVDNQQEKADERNKEEREDRTRNGSPSMYDTALVGDDNKEQEASKECRQEHCHGRSLHNKAMGWANVHIMKARKHPLAHGEGNSIPLVVSLGLGVMNSRT